MGKNLCFRYVLVSFVVLILLSVPLVSCTNLHVYEPETAVVIVTEPAKAVSGGYFEALFTNPPTSDDSIGVEGKLIGLINGARYSVDGVFYELDLPELADALINAQKRGLSVRLVYDNAQANPHPERVELIKKLEAAGIVLVPDKRSAYMHNKFFIVDGSIVWTGSFNFTENAAHKNNENAVIFQVPQLAENYEKEFEEMFLGKRFGVTSPSDTPHPEIVWNGITINNYFAPEDKVMAKVIAVVKKAKYSIDFLTFSFTDVDLGYVMSELAANNDVIVRGVFESRQDMGDSVCPYMMERNKNIDGNGEIILRLDGNPAIMHEKVIIIDNEIVIFGSFNFSANATKNNDENLLIVHDPGMAEIFETEFNTVFGKASDPIDGCKKR